MSAIGVIKRCLCSRETHLKWRLMNDRTGADQPFYLPSSGSAATRHADPVFQCPMGPFEEDLLGHLSEAGAAMCSAARQNISWWNCGNGYPLRRLEQSWAPDLDVYPARANPAPFGKTVSQDPPTRSPRRCWWSVKCRSGRDLAHGVST